MAERIMQQDLDAVINNLNGRLPRGIAIHCQGRNGYFGLDEYRHPYPESLQPASDWYMSRTLVTGTKRECYEACWHMIRGIDLAAS